MLRILILEDEPALARLLTEALYAHRLRRDDLRRRPRRAPHRAAKPARFAAGGCDATRPRWLCGGAGAAPHLAYVAGAVSDRPQRAADVVRGFETGGNDYLKSPFAWMNCCRAGAAGCCAARPLPPAAGRSHRAGPI
ncbi:MAG: hypothetical protein WKG07_48220 [Hymenobacter sp.]